MTSLDSRCFEAAREILHHNLNGYALSLDSSLRDDPYDLRDLVEDLEELDDEDEGRLEPTGQVEILCNGTVHYRRPFGHPDIAEALQTPGYTVRVMYENEDRDMKPENVTGQLGLFAPGAP